MMGLERFTKDNLRRVMQKNWNATLYPLYGGTILRPLRRKIRIDGAEDDEEVIRVEEIPHPISNSFEMYNHAADDAAEGDRPWQAGYFVFKNVLGRAYPAQNNAVFYDIYLLNHDIIDEEAF